MDGVDMQIPCTLNQDIHMIRKVIKRCITFQASYSTTSFTGNALDEYIMGWRSLQAGKSGVVYVWYL